MKKFWLILLGLLLFIYAFGLYWFIPSGRFGYYGKFNRVQQAIQDIPGAEIIDVWQHKDITLEDFSFVIRFNGAEEIKLDFFEADLPEIPLSSKAVKAYVEQRVTEKRAPAAGP